MEPTWLKQNEQQRGPHSDALKLAGFGDEDDQLLMYLEEQVHDLRRRYEQFRPVLSKTEKEKRIAQLKRQIIEYTGYLAKQKTMGRLVMDKKSDTKNMKRLASMENVKNRKVMTTDKDLVNKENVVDDVESLEQRMEVDSKDQKVQNQIKGRTVDVKIVHAKNNNADMNKDLLQMMAEEELMEVDVAGRKLEAEIPENSTFDDESNSGKSSNDMEGLETSKMFEHWLDGQPNLDDFDFATQDLEWDNEDLSLAHRCSQLLAMTREQTLEINDLKERLQLAHEKLNEISGGVLCEDCLMVVGQAGIGRQFGEVSDDSSFRMDTASRGHHSVFLKDKEPSDLKQLERSQKPPSEADVESDAESESESGHDGDDDHFDGLSAFPSSSAPFHRFLQQPMARNALRSQYTRRLVTDPPGLLDLETGESLEIFPTEEEQRIRLQQAVGAFWSSDEESGDEVVHVEDSEKLNDGDDEKLSPVELIERPTCADFDDYEFNGTFDNPDATILTQTPRNEEAVVHGTLDDSTKDLVEPEERGTVPEFPKTPTVDSPMQPTPPDQLLFPGTGSEGVTLVFANFDRSTVDVRTSTSEPTSPGRLKFYCEGVEVPMNTVTRKRWKRCKDPLKAFVEIDKDEPVAKRIMTSFKSIVLPEAVETTGQRRKVLRKMAKSEQKVERTMHSEALGVHGAVISVWNVPGDKKRINCERYVTNFFQEIGHPQESSNVNIIEVCDLYNGFSRVDVRISQKLCDLLLYTDDVTARLWNWNSTEFPNQWHNSVSVSRLVDDMHSQRTLLLLRLQPYLNLQSMILDGCLITKKGGSFEKLSVERVAVDHMEKFNKMLEEMGRKTKKKLSLILEVVEKTLARESSERRDPE